LLVSFFPVQTYGSEIYRYNPAPAVSSKDLTFTFDSPLYPWSVEELDALNTTIADLYPVVKTVYGEPTFNITVNVRKDPSISFSGEYSPTTNEIVLRNASQLDVLCHEMIHAFRDDNMITINNYEEGMTRAAEVEVFDRLAAYTFWNENHSYIYDVYYDGLSRQVVGSQSGNFDYVSPFLLLRYELTGYAWAKVFFENSNFFIDFNRVLYDRTLRDPSVRSDESQLLEIANSLQPSVEGKPFLTWYGQQGVLNRTPQTGYFLYQNISTLTVYYFYRDISGFETMQPGATIQWAVYDHQDLLVDSGSDVTSLFGWIPINPVFPSDYKGRIKIVAAVLSPDGMITNTAIRSVGEDVGIFGIIADTDSGIITVTPLDNAIPAMSTDVINGAFAAPSLAVVRGRFIAVYSDNDGQTFSRQFNKDASNYFLSMVKSNAAADLSVSLTAIPEQIMIGNDQTYNVTVINNGPETATEVVLTDILPNGAAFVSATTAQGSCIFSAPVITCALNTLSNGSSITVTIVVTSTLTGSMKNTIEVTGNVSDPDMVNNTVVSTSAVVDITPLIAGKIVLLINQINNLADAGILNQGQGNSLNTILRAAKMQVERNKTTMTVNQLHAFIEHISAFVRADILSQSQGEELIAPANDIIAQLEI
jgi:uncharacterized repeat protein (TIGR01451 family)